MSEVAAAAPQSVQPLTVMPGAVRRRHKSCQMVTEAGVLCTDPAIYQDAYRDQLYCTVHGSAITAMPDVVDKLQLTRQMVAATLVGLSLEAVDVLQEVLTGEDLPMALRLKASTEVLNRTGFGPSDRLTVEVKQDNAGMHEVSAADVIKGRLDRLAEGAKIIEFVRSEDV